MVKELGGLVAGTAGSVATAKDKIRDAAFDCVMLDLNLGGKLSLGVAAELEARDIPYVFCTADINNYAGFEHVPRIMKPYVPNGLGDALNEAMARKNRHPHW